MLKVRLAFISFVTDYIKIMTGHYFLIKIEVEKKNKKG